MKKIVFCFILFSAVLTACVKQTAPEQGPRVDVIVEIRGTVPVEETKSVGNTLVKEMTVNSLQVFAFNNGNLEDYKSVDNSFIAALSATSGMREIWAVVNAPSLAAVRSLAELKASASMLADNDLAGFVMIGSTTHELSSANDNTNPIAITVKRVVSKVSLQKISSDFQYTMSGARFDVKKIYLINVVGAQPYSIGGSSSWVESPSLWLNQLGYVSSAADEFLYDVPTSAVVRNGAPYNVVHDFYPYPNAIGQSRVPGGDYEHSPSAHGTNSYSGTWSPRQTQLVIEGRFYENDSDLVGVAGFYPIDLPALERNKTYLIEEVKLTRRPSTEPYDPVETGQSYVTISVVGWETGLSLGTIVC